LGEHGRPRCNTGRVAPICGCSAARGGAMGKARGVMHRDPCRHPACVTRKKGE
jgi:hypothetical protein